MLGKKKTTKKTEDKKVEVKKEEPKKNPYSPGTAKHQEWATINRS